MGSVRSLLMGLDVSPRRMGWALVDLVSGEPVACGCEAIELPKNGWDRGKVHDALDVVSAVRSEVVCGRCDGRRRCEESYLSNDGHGSLVPEWATIVCPGCDGAGTTSATEIQAAYIEHPISRFPGMAYDEGRAVGMVHCEVQRRWPHAPVEYLKPSEWRLLAGLKGNASKKEVMTAALSVLPIGIAWRHELRNDISQDAADALLIAVAGQRRNGENWSRAVDRGEAA